MKFLRYLRKKRRAVLAMAALTFFAAPLAAQASTITDKNGKALTPTNKVYNIEVQKKLSGGQVGVNRFKDFTLDSGEIANMQFGKLQTLANLVEKKININGTVNALRNGKIGGNLYFLSPNGIAVGSTGVINAGAFTGMAVDRSYFDELDGIDNAKTFMTKLAPKNIVYNNSADRGIDIQGVINAPGGISLYASKIDVGKDAVLRTNVDKIGKLEKVDFKSVVNITSADGSVLVDSGITGGLDASYKDGNIILKARAEHIADDNFLSGKGSTKWEKVTAREATINVDGKIKSAGKVSINAEAETEFKEGSYLNIVQQSGIADAFLGSLGIDCAVDFAKKDNTATVNIKNNADISSKGDMDISSTAKLTVKINATTPGVKAGTTKATDWIPATSVAVISATNKATVNIDGKLESKEGAMAINAKADTSLSGTAKTATIVGKSGSEEGLKDDVAYIAIGIIDGETTAEVNINSGDEIKVGGKDYKKKVDDKEVDASAFEATATTKNTVSNSVTAATKATSKGSKIIGDNDDIAFTAAINVTDYDATANVNVNRSINAENGGIKLDATNTFDNSMDASTVTGREVKPIEDWTAVKGPEFLNSISNNLAKKATSSLQKATSNVPNGAGGSTLSKIFNGEYFKTGVTVGVFAQENNAKVSVGNNAALKAKNNIDVSALNKIEGLSLSVNSTVNNQTKNQKTSAMMSLGVLVSDIDNNSDIIVDDNLTSTKGNVTIKTDSGMNYNTAEALAENFVKTFEGLADDVKKLGEDEYNTFVTYTGQVNKELDKLEKTEDPAEYMTALNELNKSVKDTKSTGFDAAVKAIDDGAKVKKDLEGLPEKLTSFLHPSNYANYYALSAFYADTEKGNKDTKLEAAGAFSINSMLNNSRIVVGDNSVISAENGTVNTNSLAQNRVVAITGMGGEHLTSSEAQNNGAGISVMVGNFKNNAVTTFGKNSQIKASDVKLETKDYAKHVNIIYGNGKADSTSITGMVSYINSPANSILSLDDSTKLNASGKVDLNAGSENYISSINGGITMGNGGGKSFGAAINILNNDATTSVIVADNGVNSKLSENIKNLQSEIETESDKDSPDQNILVDKKAELKILEITKAAQDILGEDYVKKLGDALSDKGEISADTFNTKSENTGTINSIAVEGTENSESHGLADKFNENVYKGEVQLGYAEGAFKWPANKLSKMLGNKINDAFKSEQNNPADAANQAGNAAGNENGGAGGNAGVDNNVESQLNVAGAGSAAINIKSGETGSFISNTKINAKSVDVSANDNAFHGSWAGAGAFNFFGESEVAKNTNVAIGGAVAYSDNSKNVDSVIKNSEINAASIKNAATRDDSDVSAGMGLAVSTNNGDQGTNVDVAISASINFIDGDTHALLIDNTVKGGSLKNKATIDSLQVAGGLDIAASSGGGKGFNIGGSAVASKITNDLQSGIKGGSYENLGNVDITADKKSNQIDVAVAGGITAGSDTKGFSFGGAVAVSDINNNSRAFLNNTTNFNSSGTVKVDALDSKNENSRAEYLSSRSINTDPTSFLDSNDKGKVDGTNGGGNIVNVALGGGASTGEAGAGGLGISYAGLSNLMNVDISNNQNITVKTLDANTTNKSNIVNVTMGLAGSNKSFSAAGSFGVSDMLNDGTINIKNSNVTADSFLSGANSSAHIVNVAGQAALAKEFAGGLTFAYNAMNNTTGINVEKGTWNVKNFGADATNDNYALAIAAGVAFSKENAALNGSIGLNLGNNSTKAIVDGLTMNGVKIDDETQNGIEKLKVSATDKTSKTTVAGGVTITKDGSVAAGGAVAYADIGTSNNKEVIHAKVMNSKITAENNSTIDVEALDNATMTTVAVGVGGSVGNGTVATFQGAAAVSELNKENVAEISNTDITKGTADITIKATSGGNSSEGLTIGDKKIDVNNKVNTAAAVLDANLSDESYFDGGLAISVNKFNQSTEANFKNTSRPEILSRAGNVNMFSNSEADILGVALGGAGGSSKVSAAGSVSYNYIDNSAKTLVENVNVKADKNFGVVAQSDDKMANYAGAVDVDVNGYGSIGVSVAYNEIKGNTDTDIKNSNIEVGGSSAENDLIAVSNPQDSLINSYVTRDTWTSDGLFKGRKTSKKSGLVVNSSATHSISSDLATIGIRANTEKMGVGISGTLNINKIGGNTNAKVEDTEVTADKTDAFVNAADYTNNGSFVGSAALSGTAAIGFLWNENQIDRETNAFVGGTGDSYKPALKVKNLDVKADAQQGLSNLNIAVGASFTADKKQVFAAASGDNVVRNQLEGTTTAKLENATVEHSGNVDVNAYHKDNAFATNIAVGGAVDAAGKVGASFDLGYGLMRADSTVKAEINNSTLTSKEKGAVNVNAENNSKLTGSFGTAGIAAHIGGAGATAAIALGINNNYIENKVNASINNSTLDVGAVNVDAKNTSTVKADGGVAAVAATLSKSFFAALGTSVAVTNATFDNKVTAEVNKSTIDAAGDVNINARDDHKSDETVVSAAASTGIGVAVNRMSTSVNSGLTDLKASDLGKGLTADSLVTRANNATPGSSIIDLKQLNGEFGAESRFIKKETIDKFFTGIHTNSEETKNNINNALNTRHDAPENYGLDKKPTTTEVTYNNKLGSGVFANVVNGSTINAGDNKISIGSTENNDLSITSGSGNAGLLGIGVGSMTIQTRRANATNVVGSSLNAKNIDLSTTNGQTGSNGILSKMYNATLAATGVSVGYNNVETNGTGEISIAGSNLNVGKNITAGENINLTATDNSKSKSYILDAGLDIIGYTGVFAYNTNTSQTGIEVNYNSALNAKNINFDTQNHTHRATDTMAISAGVAGVQTNTSEAKDTSKNFIVVKGAGNSFTADTLNFNALNGSQLYAYNNGQGYKVLNVIVVNGLANANTTSDISIADGNTFKADTVNLTAQVGEDGKTTAMAEGFAINVAGIGVSVDKMTAQTESTASVNVGNEFFKDDTTLNVSALNKASRDSFMRNNAYALGINANAISAYTKAKDKAEVTVGSDSTLANANKLGVLNITSDSDNKSYVAAEGTGGAIVGEFGEAARAENAVDNTSTATLNGTWNIANDLTLTANQHDGAYISGYSARGAVITGGKGSIDNEIKGSSTAKISDDAKITAKTVNVNSKNYVKTDKYSYDYDYTLFGRMGGVVDDADEQISKATTNKSANINIGKNAAITTTGTQTYDAASDYDLQNKVYGEGGSLLLSLHWARSHNYITANENINVGEKAVLKNEGGLYEDGGITLAAHDNLKFNFRAKGYAQVGVAGYVLTETLTDLTRNQNIDINGTLKSAKDLNLYAGADTEGERSKVNSYAESVAQSNTIIPGASTEVTRKGKSNSNVNVNSGAYGEAKHDVNIISNAGHETYEATAFYGGLWGKGRSTNALAVTGLGNVTTNGYKHSNKAKVDGSLKAGSTPNATINISGVAVPDEFLLVDENAKNLSYSVTSGNETVTKRNTDFTDMTSEKAFAQYIYNGITTGMIRPEDTLVPRYEEIEKIINDYKVEGRNDIVAYNSLLQEQKSLEEELEKLGMGSYDTTGKFLLDPNPSIGIKSLVLPNVEVSGGSINVVTDNFNGSGNLNASGVPQIDIENNSTAYLVANKLTVADKGGNINFNGKSVTSNSEIGGDAKFAEIKVANSEEIPTIKVSNNYSGSGSISVKVNPKAEGYSKLPDEVKKEGTKYTPLNYIDIIGDVTNPVGKAFINNKNGSIKISTGATVNAMDIEMRAKDSITQGYTKSIVNIAYNPEDAYADEAKKLRAKVGWDKAWQFNPDGNTLLTSEETKNETSDWTYKGGSPWKAGKAIYIAARDININGLIQSGYSGFNVNITQDDLDNATETTFFNDTLMYKVNDGGEKLNSKGYYVYEPQVYYDKANNKLYVDDIDSSSGKIYLAGRISSTGNGKIIASDGVSNINITNTSSADMSVGKVTSNEGEGFIQIVDSAQDKLTEYSSGKTRTIENYSAWLADNKNGSVTEGKGLSIGQLVKYNPKSGLTYNWTEGAKQAEKVRYMYKVEFSYWGAKGDSDYNECKGNLKTLAEQVIPKYLKKKPSKASRWSINDESKYVDTGIGKYIDDGTVTSDNFKLRAQNVVMENAYQVDEWKGPYYSCAKFYKDYDLYFYKTVGTMQTYTYSLKADYPISVGIIGEKGTPSINLANTSNKGGDLYLAGDIRNDKGTLNISAKSGSIIQDADVKISTDNINLSALNDIKNINIVNHRTDDLKLNAKSTSNEGKISVNVTGGIHNNQNLKGAVVVDALNSKYGEVQLTAQGDIKQTSGDAPINARNIKLESTDGSINLQIKSDGQRGTEISAISAAAKGDIKLTKADDADFLIGSIVSTSGDVELKANGKFVDALDKVRDNSDMQKSELIKSWIDMGLIAGTDDYKGAYLNRLEQERDNYKADVTGLFKEYQALLVAYQKQLDEYNSFEDKSVLAVYQGVTDPAKVKAPEKSDRLVLLEKKFANYDSEDAYLAADADYQTLVSTAANPQYQWTEEELLSSIRSSIVNKPEGASYDVTRLKDANITARNVTLTGAGVGSNSKETTTINMSELRVKPNETAKEKSARLEKLSALANVEAADVKVNYVLENGKPVKQTITQVIYRHDAEKGYYIDEAGNYIRYRNDADGNLLKYTYDEDLNQVGDAVKVAKDANGNYDLSDIILETKTIENKEIESFEISGKIPVGINATGNITVNTTGNNGTYIAGRNKGVKITETTNPNKNSYSPLNINKIEKSELDGNYGDVRIVGEAGIFNAADSGENVIGKHLVLVGGNGAIGTQEKPFTVRLTGDLLDSRANDEINLKSVGDNNFRVSAMYSPKAIRITTDENTRIEHSAQYDEIDEAYIRTPGELTLNGISGTSDAPLVIRPDKKTVLNLKGGDNFYIKGVYDGTINLNDISGKLEIDTAGSIKQTATGTNNLTDIKVAAGGDVILDGNNKLNAIELGTIGGTFELKNDSDKLTANFREELTGKVGITQRGDIDLTGSVSGSVLSLTSEKGNITSTGGLQAADEIKLSSATFTHKGEIHTDKLTIATDNGVKIDNTENSFSALEIASRNGKAINGSIEVTIKADKFAPTIKSDITGDVTLTNTKTGGLLSFGDGETINIGGNFAANSAGNFEYGSTLLTGKDIDIRAQNIYRRAGTTGYFDTTGRIVFNVDKGNQIGTADNPIMIANSAAKTDGLTLYGKANIKGVNDGILTLGKVSSEDVSISSEDSIAQVDDKTEVINAKKITVAAAKDIVLDNANNNIETLTIDSTAGDAKVKVARNLTLADNSSAKNITLTVGKNLISEQNSVLKAAETITLNAADINLSGKVQAETVDVTTGNELVMNNDANAIKALTAKSDGEQINGSVSVTSNFEIPDEEPDNLNVDDYIFSAQILNKVAGDLTLKSNGIVSLKSFSDDALLKTLEVDGNLTLDTGIGFITARPIYSDKNLNIISREGGMFVINFDSAENNETLKAAKNVKLNTADSIDIEGQITAGSGNIEINSRKNGINIFDKAQLLAGKDIALTVGEGDINIEGSVTANKGNVTMSIDTGNLNIEKTLRAKKGTVDIAIGEGNIQIGNDTTEQKGELVLFAKGDINMETGNGMINISGNHESASGSINIQTNEKTQNTSANVAEFYSYDGTPVLFSANVVETDSSADAKEPGDITIKAELKANNSVSITTDDGDIEITKSIKVLNGDITIATSDGNITIDDNGAEDMLSAQNDLDILTDNGAVTISGKISTTDGDITITSSQDSYTSGQKGITVEETGAINPGRNVNLNVTNGDIEFKKVSADNAEIKAVNGDVTADTIRADDTIRIELEHGDLYLNLAQSKGVAILTDSNKSSVKTIRSDNVTVDRNIVTVGQVVPYRITPTPSKGTSTTRSYGYSNSYNSFTNNLASNRSSSATLGTALTRGSSNLTTYWQAATSTAPTDYSFGEFDSTSNDMSYRLTRNYFEVRFVPTWLEKEFMAIDFDYSFDNFGIQNATADELTID